MKMISRLGATSGASYSSLKGLLFPCASSTSRSPTLCRSFAVGMSFVMSRVPSNSSCSCCTKSCVWLDGENGGVMLSGASIDILGSGFMADCESGGEGGAVDIFGAEVAMGAGTDLLFDVSMLKEGTVGVEGAVRRLCCRRCSRKPAVPELEDVEGSIAS
jgi:hypothetical protein